MEHFQQNWSKNHQNSDRLLELTKQLWERNNKEKPACMYLSSGSPSRKLPAPRARSICIIEGCGGRRGSLFGGAEVVEFVGPSEGFLLRGRLVCWGEDEEEEEESGFWGRVALVTTMGLVIERLHNEQNIAECFGRIR